MDFVTLLGLLAGTLTTISFVPQLLKTWRSRSAKDISASMFITFCIGVLLWLIYGICIQAVPIIIANAVTLTLASIILFFKVRFG
jgi:MtN3 and saliva related transmembrane protein